MTCVDLIYFNAGGGHRAAAIALQQAMHQQLGADDVVPAGFLTGNTAGDSAGGTGNVMLNASTLIMLNHLMERLRVLESQQISALTSNASDNMGENLL